MKTLVIHPHDVTTDFLSVIYSNTDWTILTKNTSHKNLKELIKSHNRIIMLGHGTEHGLIGHKRFIINSKLVYLLKEKLCVCIWCNADKFVDFYRLKGLYTGMIISELEEAILYCVPATLKQIKESNKLFADTISKYINADYPLTAMKEMYTTDDNPVIDFNRQNIYFNIFL